MKIMMVMDEATFIVMRDIGQPGKNKVYSVDQNNQENEEEAFQKVFEMSWFCSILIRTLKSDVSISTFQTNKSFFFPTNHATPKTLLLSHIIVYFPSNWTDLAIIIKLDKKKWRASHEVIGPRPHHKLSRLQPQHQK